jgi:hypothetical protein
MSRILLITISLGLQCFYEAVAQTSTAIENKVTYPTHISMNALSPFIPGISISLEKQENDDASHIYNVFLAKIRETDITALGASFEYRFYLDQQYPRGYFLQPYARMVIISGYGEQIFAMGAGLLGGLQRVYFDRLTVTYYFGPYYAHPFRNDADIRAIRPIWGSWFRTGLNIGLLLN